MWAVMSAETLGGTQCSQPSQHKQVYQCYRPPCGMKTLVPGLTWGQWGKAAQSSAPSPMSLQRSPSTPLLHPQPLQLLLRQQKAGCAAHNRHKPSEAGLEQPTRDQFTLHWCATPHAHPHLQFVILLGEEESRSRATSIRGASPQLETSAQVPCRPVSAPKLDSQKEHRTWRPSHPKVLTITPKPCCGEEHC